MEDKNHWQRYYRIGIRRIREHEPENAVEALRRAVKLCPVKRKRELSRALYFLGVAMRQAGFCESALRSWKVGARYRGFSYAAKLSNRFSNEYGMLEQRNRRDNDAQAFFSIHLGRYLETKRSRRIHSAAERDIVFELIAEAWSELSRGIDLAGMSAAAKLKLFREVFIVFPFLHTDDLPQGDAPRVIKVDFRRQGVQDEDGACRCGSNLGHLGCCGHIPGLEELDSGSF